MSEPNTIIVAEYKRFLQNICDNRPSGTRGRLAVALNTNRSFVSQLVNPAYAMPIPAQHLQSIFDVCRFSPAERRVFLNLYDRAHPGRRDGDTEDQPSRLVSLRVPDLGDTQRNRAVDMMLSEYTRHLIKILAVQRG